MPADQTVSTPDQFLQIGQLVTMLGISKRTIERLVDAGRLPRPLSKAFSRHRLWSKHEVQAAMNEQMRFRR